jgi:hypothetical protein
MTHPDPGSRSPYGLWGDRSLGYAAGTRRQPEAADGLIEHDISSAFRPGGPPSIREGVSPGRQHGRQGYAALASVVFHAIVLALMVPWNVAHSPGQPGPDAGAGIDVALVSAATLGIAAPHAAPMNAMVTTPAPTPPATAPADASATLGKSEALFSPTDQPSHSETTPKPQTVAWAATETSKVAGTLDGTRRGAGEAAGGDPAATDELLSQIAKCLPSGMRPRLIAQRLVLNIGPHGGLAVAPMIDSTLPLLTAEDRAAADIVVQAALQCGPYQPSEANRTVSLAVDFSAISSAPSLERAVR